MLGTGCGPVDEDRVIIPPSNLSVHLCTHEPSDLPPDDTSSIAESEPQSLVAGGSGSVGGVDEEWEGSDISLTQDREYSNTTLNDSYLQATCIFFCTFVSYTV